VHGIADWKTFFFLFFLSPRTKLAAERAGSEIQYYKVVWKKKLTWSLQCGGSGGGGSSASSSRDSLIKVDGCTHHDDGACTERQSLLSLNYYQCNALSTVHNLIFRHKISDSSNPPSIFF